MEKKDLRIVYMGTPDFAVESLKCLVEGGYNVVGVITMPDKPMGRHGSVLQPSPVKQYAVSQGLRVLQPERLKDESFVEELRSLQADLHCGGISNVTRSGLEYASPGNVQSSCLFVASVQRSSPHQLGSHQWRYRNGYHHLLLEA